MINLIPNEEKKKKVKDFYFRFLVMFFTVLGFSILIASASILPAYFISSVKKNLINTKLEIQKNEPIPSPDQTTLAIVEDLNNKLSLIEKTEVNKYIISQKIIKEIMAEKMPDIKITGILYQNNLTKGKTININGTAPNRERLLLFRQALENNIAFKKFQKTPLFLSIIFLVFSCFIFLFFYEEIQNNSKTSELAQITWRSEANKRNETQSLNRSLQMTKQERTLLETHFIRSSDVVPFLDMIEKLAPEVGARVEISLVDIPKDNSGLIVEMKVTGIFEALYKFLTLLENSPYELDFISMDIQKLGGEIVSDKIRLFSQWSAIFRIKLLSFIQ